MAISTTIIKILFSIGLFIISALPLYFSVKLLKGKTTLLKTIIVTFLSGIIVTAIENFFQWFGGLIAFIILIWIYHEVFRLKWWKALVAWFLQFVFILLFYIFFAIFFASIIGVSMFLF